MAAGAGKHEVMDAKTETNNRRRSSAGQAEHNGYQRAHQHQPPGAGIDLPIFGHVEYERVGFLAGLGVAGAVGVLEWPVAVAVGLGYELARRGRPVDR